MEEKLRIYLDNAASTWPKPECVPRAVEHIIREAAANPGRSGHTLSIEAARVIAEARRQTAALFGISDPLRLVFTGNATGALNIVIQGMLGPGDHVITSAMEHNSVMRPLRAMELRGVEVSVVACSADGTLDPDDVGKAIRRQTALVVLTHASNVSGTVMPVSQVGAITSERGIPLCVDASQTAGCLPIDVGRDGIDLLAFTGHKSLYGPQGTGGLYVREGLEARISPLAMGGTGSASEREEQPLFMPDKYESGTPNTPGIAGLLAGIDFVASQGVERIREHEMTLARRLMEGLAAIEGIRVIGPRDPYHRIAVVSFTLEGVEPSEVAFRLDDEFGIMIRSGLHCAPSAHRALGTFPQGTVRASIGFFNTARDIDETIDAVASIAYNR
ncbi:MAG TPA: aminotransferase class V-fold PLP-dependent enzyme [Deltaproteobacteria bacterium]|nr:aminotransferase class V-fold PLP-dependent enzyme [Deltaproteobacteria bacterium]HQI80563.1 aminotransferase class V-fold PLP-dependent enzyme [Deltaproteobacteria bacterium]